VKPWAKYALAIATITVGVVVYNVVTDSLNERILVKFLTQDHIPAKFTAIEFSGQQRQLILKDG
jgi:hypothetical protein